MLRIKSLLFLLILLLAAAACTEQKATQTGAPLSDSEENRLAAAKEYLKVAPAEDVLKEMTASLKGKLPEKLEKKLIEVLASKPIQEATYQITLKALAKHFTVGELKAMTTFYQTPEGKSVRLKMGAYLSDLLPQIYQEVGKAMKEAEPQAAPGPQAPPAPQPAPQPQVTPAPKAPPAPAAPKPAAPPAAK